MQKTLRVPITVIGGGVVGLACSLELAKRFGPDQVYLFEKHEKLGQEQSSRNSGVIHSGIYYKPGSLKAKLCVEGNYLIREFCQKYNVPFISFGKLIVAQDTKDEEALEFYRKTAQENGVCGVEVINQRAIKNFEPNVLGYAALHAPNDGVIDTASYLVVLEKLAQEAGVTILRKSFIAKIEPHGSEFKVFVETTSEKYGFCTEILINAAGLYASDIAGMISAESSFEIQLLRGEYCLFNRYKRQEVFLKGLIVNPMPRITERGEENYITLGEHLTPTFEMSRDNSVSLGRMILVGPTTDPVENRDDYGPNRHQTDYFLEKVKSFFPGLRLDDLHFAGYCGIRAKLKLLPDDFVLKRDPCHANCIHCFADSPGLTSSLAIAKYVSEFF